MHRGYFWRGEGSRGEGERDGEEERDGDSHLHPLRGAGENYVCCRCPDEEGVALSGDRRTSRLHTGV